MSARLPRSKRLSRTRQSELRRSRHALDRAFAAQGGRAVRVRLAVHDRQRPATPRVPSALAGTMRGEPRLHVVRRAGVQRPVAAAEQVHVPGRHAPTSTGMRGARTFRASSERWLRSGKWGILGRRCRHPNGRIRRRPRQARSSPEHPTKSPEPSSSALVPRLHRAPLRSRTCPAAPSSFALVQRCRRGVLRSSSRTMRRAQRRSCGFVRLLRSSRATPKSTRIGRSPRTITGATWMRGHDGKRGSAAPRGRA